MNLSKIINSMEKLAEKHRFINNKFNAKGQAPNVFRADIKEDLLNDRKIFGYTHEQAVAFIKQSKNPKQNDQTEAEIQKNSEIFIESKIDKIKKIKTYPKEMNKSNIHFNARGRSAVLRPGTTGSLIKKKSSLVDDKSQKNLRYGNKLYCLTTHLNDVSPASETVFCRLKNSTYKSSSNQENREKKNKKICRKSIKHYRRNFSNNFESNVEIMKLSEKQSECKIRMNRKTMIFEEQKKQKEKRKKFYSINVKKPYSIFKLTEANAQQAKNDDMQQMMNQKVWLKNLSYYLCDDFQAKTIIDKRKINNNKWYPAWDCLYDFKFYNVFLIEMGTLRGRQYDKMNFQKIEKDINSMLKRNQNIHFGVYNKKQEKLVYQEFIFISKSGFSQQKQELFIFQYFIKRFLCMDTSFPSIQTVQIYSLSFIKNQIKIPVEFQNFIYEMKAKQCIIYNFRHRVIRLKMKDVLMKGFKVLKNNKRLLKWEERNPVEISKISTKKQKEYFYI